MVGWSSGGVTTGYHLDPLRGTGENAREVFAKIAERERQQGGCGRARIIGRGR